jgi:hypothetical protein
MSEHDRLVQLESESRSLERCTSLLHCILSMPSNPLQYSVRLMCWHYCTMAGPRSIHRDLATAVHIICQPTLSTWPTLKTDTPPYLECLVRFADLVGWRQIIARLASTRPWYVAVALWKLGNFDPSIPYPRFLRLCIRKMTASFGHP